MVLHVLVRTERHLQVFRLQNSLFKRNVHRSTLVLPPSCVSMHFLSHDCSRFFGTRKVRFFHICIQLLANNCDAIGRLTCSFLRSDLFRTYRHCSQSHRHLTNVFKCDLCTFSCSVYGTLVDHCKSTHGLFVNEKSYKCLLCHRGLVWDNSLEALMHLASHTGSELFICKFCDHR
jgi:hypothetical protein